MTSLNRFRFLVTESFNPEHYTDHQKALLDAPSGLTEVFLCSNWPEKWRPLNFEGTTVHQAIQKIITFYGHRTHRRLIGNLTEFAGVEDADGYMYISLQHPEPHTFRL